MSETAGQHLPRGTKVSRYEVRDVLGSGGFGITYKVFDTRLECEAAMKEYLPAEFAARVSDNTTVVPRSQEVTQEYQHGLTRFLDEARVLAKFKNRHIVRVSDYMEVNGTAYLIMDYEEGQSLRQLLKQRGGSLSETEIKKIFLPILDGLKAVHEAGLLHRDIKPDNIYLRKKGPPVLLDFGAARQYAASQTSSVTAMVTPGYAPFEQYQPNGELGVWTDIYALGATLYACITGKPPVDAITRHAEPRADPLVPALEAGGDRYSEGLLRTVDWMLRPSPRDRPKSVDEVQPCIQGRAEPPEETLPHPADATSTAAPTVKVPPPDASTEPAPDAVTALRPPDQPLPRHAPEIRSSSARRVGLAAGIAAVVLIGAGAGWWYIQDQNERRFAIQEQQRQEAEAARMARIEGYLGDAEQALEAGRYMAPGNDNALAYFRRVLESEPGNERARQGMDRLFDALLSRAEQAAAIADFEGAGEYLDDAAGIYPGNPDLVSARESIAALEAVRLAQVESKEAAGEEEESRQASAVEGEVQPAVDAEAKPEQPTMQETAVAEGVAGEAPSEEGATEPAMDAQATSEQSVVEESVAAGAATGGTTGMKAATPQSTGEAAQKTTGKAGREARPETDENAQQLVKEEAVSGEQVVEQSAPAEAAAMPESGAAQESTVSSVDPSTTRPASDEPEQAPGAPDDADKVTGNVDEFLTALMLEASQSDSGGTATASAEPAAGAPQPASSEVEALLRQADSYLAASNLVAPDGRNATMLYGKVLAMDPDNSAALAGMNRIAAVYEKAAGTMLDEGRPDIGRRIVRRGLNAVPDHPGLLRLQATLEAQ